MTQVQSQVIEEPEQEQSDERSTGPRKLRKPWSYILTASACFLAAFHLYNAGIGVADTWILVSVHVAFMLLFVYFLYPCTDKSPSTAPSFVDLILACLGMGSCFYITFNISTIISQMGMVTTQDLVLGGILILVLLEAGRRTLGKALPIVAICFILFALFGRYIPGAFRHSGYSFEEIIAVLFCTDEGIWGSPIKTSAEYVILFIFFGAIMSQTGMSRLLNDFSLGLAGWMTGGPAKVAVVSSGLMGTVSGSVSANVATTGVMTIPLMKSVGYRPAYAGAVECVASAGGQIMPPVMGAAAFLMAQFLGVPYSQIIVAAILPALLYYGYAWVCVDLRARKEGMRTVARSEIPPLRVTLREYGHLSLPLFALIYFLSIKQYNAIYSAWLAILMAIGISSLRKHTRLSPWGLLKAFESGVRSAISVAIACAVAGMVVGMIALTGFGLVFSLNILSFSFGHLWLTLVLGMVAAIILGMGLPTTACYIVTALTLAPALINMGVVPLAAHMFVFYFSIMSTVTPPVALSSFVAAGIAGSSPVTTGLIAFRLAIGGFFVPYLIVYMPEIMMTGYSGGETALAMILGVMFIIIIGTMTEGYFFGPLSMPLRIMIGVALLVAGIFLSVKTTFLVLSGLMVLIMLFQKKIHRKQL